MLTFLTITIPLSAQAQLSSTSEFSATEQQALMAQQARQQATDRILAAGGVPLEGAIDPDDYLVGPGDVFSISTGGALSLQTTASVSADGTLVIPEIGSYPVAGRSLAETRTLIGTALQEAYRNVPTQIALAQPRQFYVHVSGEVARPGRHVAVPVARVEDALSVAMEGNNPLRALQAQRRDYVNYDGLPALRNVTVHRQDGERLVVDLMRYYATGDTQYNPYLRDGDRLYVPTFTNDGEAVFVEYENKESLARSAAGALQTNIDVYDYRSDDTITALLLVAGGPELLAGTSTVRLLRSDGGALRARDVDVQAILDGSTPNVALQPRDRILLSDALDVAGVAEAGGFVTYPGTYPIVPGVTTLRDLVDAAGGIRPDGLLRAAYLERQAYDEASEPPTPFEPTVLPENQSVIVDDQVFRQARLADLSFVGRQYLTRELLQNQRVSLELGPDIASIPAVPLRDGDRFVVPRDPGAVLVIGQVRNPGYVPFVAGADAEYYIEQAGGRSRAASDVYIREAGSGDLQLPSEAEIFTGDAVFVDRPQMADTESQQSLAIQEQQLDFQRSRETADRRFRYVQTGLAILGTAVSVITTYLLITRENSN